MNEFLFFSHILAVIFFVLVAFRFGKEALISTVALQGILANFFVFKQIALFGFHVTASDVFAISGTLGLNLLVEFFGKKTAKKAIWISFFFLIFCFAMGSFHLGYLPSLYDVNHGHYASLFSSMPRVIIASLTTYLLVSRFDIFFYSKLKLIFGGRHLVLYSTLALVISQLLDTALFSFLGLYGVVNSIVDVFVVSFIIKLVIIATSSPFIFVISRLFGRRYKLQAAHRAKLENGAFDRVGLGGDFFKKEKDDKRAWR